MSDTNKMSKKLLNRLIAVSEYINRIRMFGHNNSLDTDCTREEGIEAMKRIKESHKETIYINPDDKVCYHLPKDRIRTHRGYHCGNCGKRL